MATNLNFRADILHDNYPIRESGQKASPTRVLPFVRKKKMDLLRKYYDSAQPKAETQTSMPEDAVTSGRIKRSPVNLADEKDIKAVAETFIKYQSALKKIHDIDLEDYHIRAAFGLFERRIELLKVPSDRVLVAGLAASVFVQSGLRVHLIGDDDVYRETVVRKLVPIFESMGLSFAMVTVGDDEDLRRSSYSCDITLVSARECAMDFLRDSVNWPKRGNSAHRLVDRLVGRRAKHPMKILQGLPCAIHLDAQMALVSNARAPIVLTENAHPVHDIEELQRALELSASLSLGTDYIYSGKELEIAFTPQGKSKVDGWASEYGGIWLVPSAADLMIALALVVQNLLQKGQHYQVQEGILKLLLEDRLIPGLLYYGKSFMTRVLEIQNECAISGQQEIVGRASYQHVFNRYIHLCGLSRATDLAREELKHVYGLDCARELSSENSFKITNTLLVEDQIQKFNQLEELLKNDKIDAARMRTNLIVAESQQHVDTIRQALNGQSLSAACFETGERLVDALLEPELLAGSNILVCADTLAAVPDQLWSALLGPVRILILYRSIDWYEDRLLTQFNQHRLSGLTEVTQILGLDDEIFQNHPPRLALFLGNAVRSMGSFGQFVYKTLLELQINFIQKKYAKESYQVRRNLLTHDEGIQSMLSFAGKGLYE